MTACLASMTVAILLALGEPQADPPLALVGADVVVRPGAPLLEDATVLVRDGRVEAVGRELELPFDARAIDVSGLVLSAGLVDAFEERRVSFPTREDQQGRPIDDGRDAIVAMFEAERTGLAPEREVWQVLPQDAASDEAEQKAGFTLVSSGPSDMLLSGTGAWLSLSERPPREAVLVPASAQFASLEWRSEPENYEGYRYPATLMGVMAHLRQVLLDARHEATLRELHRDDVQPRREPVDAVLEALLPVLSGERLLVLEARAEEDIRLALGLQDDFAGVRLAIAGGHEAWELAEELALRGIPVIHDLDFGEEPEDPDADEEEDEEDPSRRPGRGRRGREAADVELAKQESDEPEAQQGVASEEGAPEQEAEPGPTLPEPWNPEAPAQAAS